MHRSSSIILPLVAACRFVIRAAGVVTAASARRNPAMTYGTGLVARSYDRWSRPDVIPARHPPPISVVRPVTGERTGHHLHTRRHAGPGPLAGARRRRRSRGTRGGTGQSHRDHPAEQL